MILILRNGYPFPYPAGLSVAAEDAYANAAAGVMMKIRGVVSMEWLHELTVQFHDLVAYGCAKDETSWRVWDEERLILAAPTSARDGYEHPAIVVRDTAYCGFYLGK